MPLYSNLPPAATPTDATNTVHLMNSYYDASIEMNSTVLAAMKSYFIGRGFAEVAAESITLTIMTQARADGYNPMQILDTLRGLSNVDLSGLVSEILNYNRFKSSSLGYASGFTPNQEVQRNIIDSNTTTNNTSNILFDENGEVLTNDLGETLTTE